MFQMAISLLDEVSARLPNLIETFDIYDEPLKKCRDILTMLGKANIYFYLDHLHNTFKRTRFKMKLLMIGFITVKHIVRFRLKHQNSLNVKRQSTRLLGFY